MYPLLDDFFDYFGDDDLTYDEVSICGLEHPTLEGNYCVLDYDHRDEHEDAAGNTWRGRPAYDQM